MAEPLSIAASVAGLVSLGLQSTEYLHKFYTTCRDRDEYLEKTATKLDSLLTTLRTVDNVISRREWRTDEDSLRENVHNHILQCEDVVRDLKSEAQKFEKQPLDNVASQIKSWQRRVAYPFPRSTLVKLDEDVRDFQNNLSRALEVLQLKDHQNTQEDIDVLREMMRDMKATHDIQSVKDWLGAPDAMVDYNALASKRHASTGRWFLQSQALADWQQDRNSFLWLYGFAGCGKSVLCSTTIQHIFRRTRFQPNSAVAFFFFTFNDSFKQDASAMLKALLLQLAAQIAGVAAEISHLKQDCKAGVPSVLTLVEHIRQSVSKNEHVYILIDAIDECPEGDARDGVLDVVETMRGWSLAGLHILVTSRDIPDVRDALNPQSKEIVALQNDEVQEDIRDYVSYCVDHDPKLRRWQDERQTIKDHLVKHAKGVFRWVKCQLEPLRRCPRSKYDLQRCLKQLSPTLDATYERMLSAIDEGLQERAQRMLSFICLAARELTVAEIIEALGVDIDEQECYDSTRRLHGADDLLRICPGLIDIIPDSMGMTTEYECDLGDDSNFAGDVEGAQDFSAVATTHIVRIAHFSVQEYLVSARIRTGKAACFAISEAVDHARIGKTCLIYLCHDQFLSQTLTRQLACRYAFAQFAAEYWPRHFRRGSEAAIEGLERWGIALCSDKVSFERWLKLHNRDEEWWNQDIHYSDDDTYDQDQPFASVIYYLALLGLYSLLVKFTLGTEVDVNIRGGRLGTALQAASNGGHDKVVQLLLDAGADVNVQTGAYGSALHAAAADGHDKVVRLLLDAGAVVNAQIESHGSAISAASYGGYDKVVQILLDAGADFDAQGGDYGSALQAASAAGSDKVVQLLLDAGAVVNAHGEDYHSALQAASIGGHDKIVQLLLDAGADVNPQGRYCGLILSGASYSGHDKIVQLLLDAEANVNAHGGFYGTALQAASIGGHDKIVQLLLDAGADVNAQTVLYGSAIATASYSDHVKALQLSLDAVAEDAQKGLYGNALQAASAGGHGKVVQLLLDAGADVNATGGVYHTALQAASAGGHDKVVQLLHRYGASHRWTPAESIA